MNEETIKSPRTVRLIYLVLAAMTVVLATISVTIINWSFQSDNVIDIRQPIPIKGEAVARDSVIILEIDYCKYTDATGEVERKLVGKRAEYLFPTVKDTTKAACSKVAAPTLLPVLPLGATPDTYHIEYTVTYDLNPLKMGVVEEFKTEEFEVK